MAVHLGEAVKDVLVQDVFACACVVGWKVAQHGVSMETVNGEDNLDGRLTDRRGTVLQGSCQKLTHRIRLKVKGQKVNMHQPLLLHDGCFHSKYCKQLGLYHNTCRFVTIAFFKKVRLTPKVYTGFRVRTTGINMLVTIAQQDELSDLIQPHSVERHSSGPPPHRTNLQHRLKCPCVQALN